MYPSMTCPHDKDAVPAQNEHKLDEMPFLLPSAPDPHNLAHLLKQCQLILDISKSKQNKQIKSLDYLFYFLKIKRSSS